MYIATYVIKCDKYVSGLPVEATPPVSCSILSSIRWEGRLRRCSSLGRQVYRHTCTIGQVHLLVFIILVVLYADTNLVY